MTACCLELYKRAQLMRLNPKADIWPGSPTHSWAITITGVLNSDLSMVLVLLHAPHCDADKMRWTMTSHAR